MPDARPPTRLRSWASHGPSWLVSALGLAAVVSVAMLREQQHQNNERQQVRQQLLEAKVRLDLMIESTFSLSTGLAMLVRVDGGITADRFALYVERMKAQRPQLRNVVAAPNDVIRLAYPIAGNERVLGLDYRSVPSQWAQVQRARQLRQPLVFAPVKLVQGGIGIIHRNPVFVAEGGTERYWGAVSMVADLERFIALAELPTARLDVALLNQRSDGQPGEVIWGPAELGAPANLREVLALPGATWVLIGRPKGGWTHNKAWQDPVVIGAALAASLVASMSFALGRRRRQLHARNRDLALEVEQRRLAHADAEAARARYAGLLDLSSDWVWESDAEHRLSYMSMLDGELSETLNRMVGKRRWELDNLLPGTDWAPHRAVLERHEPFRDFGYGLIAADGRTIYVNLAGEPVYDAEGRFQGYRGTGRDVSAIRKAEEALRRSGAELADARDRLQALLDAATEVAIIATDAQDRITVFNRGAERMLGYAASEVVGGSPHRFHDAEEMKRRALELKAQLGREVAAHEVFIALPEREGSETRLWTYRTREGRALQVSLTVSEVRDRQGGLLGHLGIAVDLSALVHAQTEIQEGARRLQAVLDCAVEVGIITVDLEGRIQLFSKGAERLLGASAEQMQGQPARMLHLKSEIEAEAARLSALLGQPVSRTEVFERQAAGLDGGHRRIWTYIRRDDGSRRRVSHTFTELRNLQGEHVGYLAIVLDMSEQLQALEASEAMKNQLQAVMDATIEVAIIATDLNGDVTFFNRGAERMLGYKAEEMLGRSPMPLHLRDEVEARAREYGARLGRKVSRYEVFTLRVLEPNPEPWVWTYRAKDGRLLTVSQAVSVMRDGVGQVIGYLALVRDITGERASEEQLLATRDRLQTVLDSAVDVGIVVVGLDGRVELFNRGAERLFGYAAHEVIGRSSLMFHDIEELQQRALARSVELGRKVHKHELFLLSMDQTGHSGLSHWTYVRKGGERVPGALRFNEMRSRDGKPLSYLAICMDIGEQVRAQTALETLNAELEARVSSRTAELQHALGTLQQAQEELLRSEKLAALGSLVAGVAHELNTPIGNCLTAASTLDERTRETQQAFVANSLKRSNLQAYLSEAATAGQLLLRGLRNAADLVAHFKQVSVDQTSEQRRSFLLRELVEDVLSVLHPQLKKARIDIRVQVELETPIDGYPGALGQLLSNLVLNAQIHAFGGVSHPRLDIEAHALDADWFALSVRDNGAGMNEEVRRRAFDPFFTTKMGQGGTGLGLNIVYNIATGVLGGQVELKSAPAQGALFSFKLPLVAPQKREVAGAMRAGG